MQIVIKVSNLVKRYLRSCTFSFSLVPANIVEIKVKYLMFNFWYFLIFEFF